MKKTILITGATSGIGFEAAKYIAQAGHELVFTARNAEKSRSYLTANKKAAPDNGNISYLTADFASLQSTKELAEQFAKTHDHLDVLINNAGLVEPQWEASKDGIELNFAVNHLAPFLLTNLLTPLLKAAPQGRIVNTTSMKHRQGDIDFSNIEHKQGKFDITQVYGDSKLCNLLFSLALTDRLKGTNMTVNTVHPGYANTPLFKYMPNLQGAGQTPAEGARATIYAALSPEVTGSGVLYYNEAPEDPAEAAKDKATAESLWEVSMDYVKRFL